MTQPLDSANRIANEVIERTNTNGAQAGYQMLREVELNGHLRPGEMRNLNARLVGAGVLPDLSLAYAADQQRQNPNTPLTAERLGQLRTQATDPIAGALAGGAQSQFEAIRTHNWVYTNTVDRTLVGQTLAAHDTARRTNPANAAQRLYGADPAPAETATLGPRQHEMAVRPGEGYWHLSARALGFEDPTNLTPEQGRATQELMARVRQENNNRVLHPNDTVNVRV